MSEGFSMKDLGDILSPSSPEELINLLIISAVIAAIFLIIGLKTKSVALGVILALIFFAYGTSAYAEASSIKNSWEYMFLDQDYKQLVELVLMVGYLSWILGAIVVITPIIRHFTSSKPGAQTQNEELRFCANCGAKLDDGSHFCSKCGENVGISE
ncbi:MAG: zinc ribbon domain-containing protein [Syntrophomonadaceae bacterium]|nr:zinc ribbon domain-containing protein [Syntrophomonadaceae bacterium]